VNDKDIEIHEVIEKVSMKGPIKIKQIFKPMININISP
jgi:hypothetical protein